MREVDWPQKPDLQNDPMVEEFLGHMADVYKGILDEHGEEEARFFLADACGPLFGNALRHINQRLKNIG